MHLSQWNGKFESRSPLIREHVLARHLKMSSAHLIVFFIRQMARINGLVMRLKWNFNGISWCSLVWPKCLSLFVGRVWAGVWRFHNGPSFLVTIGIVVSGAGTASATTTRTEITAGDTGRRGDTTTMGAAEVAVVVAISMSSVSGVCFVRFCSGGEFDWLIGWYTCGFQEFTSLFCTSS